MAHCWKGKCEWAAETFGENSPEHIDARYGKDSPATCMLPDDHEGSHEWTWDGDITVEFSAPKAEESDNE